MLSPKHSPTPADELILRLAEVLVQCWQETGYGHLEIDSARVNQNKIGVTIRGSTHYRYIISDQDVEQFQIQLNKREASSSSFCNST